MNMADLPRKANIYCCDLIFRHQIKTNIITRTYANSYGLEPGENYFNSFDNAAKAKAKAA